MYSIAEYENKINVLLNDINSKRPFDDKVLKNLQQWFKVAFTYASNAIE
jgi:hypothetical protein